MRNVCTLKSVGGGVSRSSLKKRLSGVGYACTMTCPWCVAARARPVVQRCTADLFPVVVGVQALKWRRALRAHDPVISDHEGTPAPTEILQHAVGRHVLWA